MEFVAQAPVIKEQHIQTWTIGPDPVLKNRVIDDVIQFLAQKKPLGPSALFKYRLCVDEAITNSITHGCKGTHQTVTIHFHWSPHAWAMQITDKGPGFDQKSIPDTNSPGNEYLEHGRGIMILQRYTDRLLYSDNGRQQTFWIRTGTDQH
ncbi:MAG: ATP-binding protein [Planctomycetota bacterium]